MNGIVSTSYSIYSTQIHYFIFVLELNIIIVRQTHVRSVRGKKQKNYSRILPTRLVGVFKGNGVCGARLTIK